ncbi:3'5'-cyclic nucleotide phosphodiesterase family protein [Tritrichomonas foetus]|uniref:3'5'-cyclic nucleotide phosphodiesterase family protein n=1 Tax=Tritrichomonas foetus TaxID=1144522 RepID=A0A1J4KK11_9EUKA|nr:3'5'-cyclic nucleotide phosphodiesterase family protein [Tritrichomonas foetus]|eukprot:OHT09685.1 3'5'-cyclic nucleotide phosphodiesterase family protein [Tritrichomonas foetus]
MGALLSNQTDSYFNHLLAIMCSERPTFSDVLNLFTREHYFQCDHYVLLAKPQVVSYYFTLCSDAKVPQRFESDLVPANDSDLIRFERPKNYNGIENINSVKRIDINENIILLLLNPSDKLPSDDTIYSLTINALQSLYASVEVDIPYMIRTVQEMTDEDLQKLSNRSFSVINFHPAELFQNLLAAFVRSGISTAVGVNSEDLLRFLVNLRRHYNDVPYHNWFHAVDVTQFVFSVIQTVKMQDYLTKYEIFGLLLSAICHDTDHNGMNNTFHRNAKTIFAHLAPNLPPLEHHHSCITMDLSRQLLSSIEPGRREEVSHFIVHLIMATDMEQHKVFLENFKDIQEGFQKDRDDHRLLLGQIVLKAADLSNTVRDFEEANRMANKLCQETHRQGDEERRRGLKVSPMCDREDKTPLCCGQVGFYKFVARPLMKELHDFFPALADNERQFVDNLARWEKMTEEVKKSQ